ncbi:MAG: S8 family peptidase [Fusicatenibacter sp.]|nr:S8 family peptidase [Fusicatenibacter sp.]
MTLQEQIYSETYANLLVRSYVIQSENYLQLLSPDSSILRIDSQYSILFLKRNELPENLLRDVPYATVPKLFSPLSTLSLEVSGIVQTQNLPGTGLTGKNVIIGFLDTGIDYTHPAFLDASGKTRILRIWDQTLQTGNPPSLFPYGSEYTSTQINEALTSDQPYTVVPQKDTNGHGTYVAGIAAGTPNSANEFLGAAPDADLVVVKLKEAKQYLRDFYLVSPDAIAYQEDDIMTALRYLTHVAEIEKKPLVICLALGSNQGSHSGSLPLCIMLSHLGETQGIIPVCATGNEGGMAHHYLGSGYEDLSAANVEIRVPDGSPGFYMELWGQAPQLFSVGFRSPVGESIPRIPVSLNQEQRITFVLEQTVIYVNYDVVQTSTGSQLIVIRLKDPTPGIWNLQVYSSISSYTDFHIWLPITGFTKPDITFLEPNPYTTLTSPSTAIPILSPSTYQASNNSIYLHSGRGFTRLGNSKPDFAAPGVDVTGPGPSGSYRNRTGSSASAAITAGAAALLLQWGMQRIPVHYFTSQELKIYLIRGATRSPDLNYPNREWGYGKLNLYHTFESLMTT